MPNSDVSATTVRRAGAAKRGYQSDLRAAQTRMTRQAVVAAATELFVSRGYSATTIDAVAEAAGVSRKTVFNAVGGKAALLKLAYDWSLVGDDEPVPMGERPAVKQILATTDPAEAVALWVSMITEIGGRVTPIGRVLEAAADVEPEAAQLLNTAQSQRHFGSRAFVDHLVAIGGLRPGLSPENAADIFWAQTDPVLYRRLVVERGWSSEQFQEWLARSVMSELLAG